VTRKSILPSIRPWLFLCLILLAATAIAGEHRERGLLWEISRPGVEPGYLFGTIHSEDPAVLELAQPVAQAYAGAQRVVLEVMMDRDALLYSSAAMLMMDGRRLSKLLGESLYSRTLAAVQTRGISAPVLERMKPWAVAVTLATPAPQTGLMLDLDLLRRAQADGKAVFGLETIQEQLEVFDGLALEDQVELLRETVDQFPGLDRIHQALIDAWKQRDLAQLMAINEVAMGSGDRRLAETFRQRLLIDRNHRMAQRLREHFDAGGTFAAVGALHLPGEEGLLNLLEDSGYQVRVRY
jgi:uncharacterized protein YbaP (TraB family)